MSFSMCSVLMRFCINKYNAEHLFLDAEPWTFEQCLGEAVFIPAGCPHQVRNRQVVNIFSDVFCMKSLCMLLKNPYQLLQNTC